MNTNARAVAALERGVGLLLLQKTTSASTGERKKRNMNTFCMISFSCLFGSETYDKVENASIPKKERTVFTRWQKNAADNGKAGVADG